MIPEISYKVFIVIGSLIVGMASYKYFGMPQDNQIEEAAETVIKEEIGISLDLSPSTPESK